MSKHKIQEWMPFYGDAFFNDERVAALDLEMRYCFIVLLWFQWREGSIIDDSKVLSRLSGVSNRTMKRALTELKIFFSKTDEGRLVNAKCAVLRGKSIERMSRFDAVRAPLTPPLRAPLDPPLREPLSPPLRAGEVDREGDRDTLTSVSVNAGARAREVAALWNSTAAPGMPPAPAVTANLVKAVARIDRADLDWRKVFETVNRSPALNGSKRFTASLGWVLRPENFERVEIGAYDSGQRGQHTAATVKGADTLDAARTLLAAEAGNPVARLVGRKTV